MAVDGVVESGGEVEGQGRRDQRHQDDLSALMGANLGPQRQLTSGERLKKTLDLVFAQPEDVFIYCFTRRSESGGLRVRRAEHYHRPVKGNEAQGLPWGLTLDQFLAKISRWITSGYPEGSGTRSGSLFALLSRRRQTTSQASREEMTNRKRVETGDIGVLITDSRRMPAPKLGECGKPPGRNGCDRRPRGPRRRNSRHAPHSRPVRHVSTVAAAVLADAWVEDAAVLTGCQPTTRAKFRF